MAQQALLVRGADKLDISDDTNYKLLDFRPPSTMENVTYTDRGQPIDARAGNVDTTFSVLIMGSNINEIQAKKNRLVSLLRQAGDESSPLELQYRENRDIPVPIWGQFGAPRRYIVVHGEVEQGDNYNIEPARVKTQWVIVTLTVKPYALGTWQFVYNSTNGGYIDRFAPTAFAPVGLRLPIGTTNKATNPVFSNRTSWSTGWTASGGAFLSNLYKDYVYPGAEISAYIASGGADRTITQSLNVGNTNTHTVSVYLKRKDGAAVTSADAQIYYGAAKTSAYRHIGNGVYLVTWSGAGINAATATGIQVPANREIYLLGMQVEEKTNWTPLAYGGLPGCAWSGTAGASTTVRSSEDGMGFMRHPLIAIGSVAIAWTPDYASTETGNRYLFSDYYNEIELYYNATDDKFYLLVSNVTISSAAQTFSAGDTLYVYAAWDESGGYLSINGGAFATGTGRTTVTASPTVTNFLIGRYEDTVPTTDYWSGGIYKAVEVYGKTLTQAEVTALHAAMTYAVSGSGTADCPAVVSTYSGVDVISHPSAPLSTFAFVDGIPGGSSPIVDIDNASADLTAGAVFSVLPDMGVSFVPDNLHYEYGGAAVSVNTTETAVATYTMSRVNELMGRMVYVAVALTDAGANLQLDFALSFGGSIARTGYKSVAAGASLLIFYLGPLYVPSRNVIPERSIYNTNTPATATLYAKRSVAGAANVTPEYVQLLPNMLAIRRTGSVATTDRLSYWDGRAAMVTAASGAPIEYLSVTGPKEIELSPQRMNLLSYKYGSSDGSAATLGGHTFFPKIAITPRWSL